MANGMDVQAAGTLKVNSQGYVRTISNHSGHYMPTVEHQCNLLLMDNVGGKDVGESSRKS